MQTMWELLSTVFKAEAVSKFHVVYGAKAEMTR